MSPDVPVRARRLGVRGRPYQLPCAVRKDGSAVFGTAVKKASGTVGGIPVAFRTLELAPYHSLGKLPEPESIHDFF